MSPSGGKLAFGMLEPESRKKANNIRLDPHGAQPRSIPPWGLGANHSIL